MRGLEAAGVVQWHPTIGSRVYIEPLAWMAVGAADKEGLVAGLATYNDTVRGQTPFIRLYDLKSGRLKAKTEEGRRARASAGGREGEEPKC